MKIYLMFKKKKGEPAQPTERVYFTKKYAKEAAKRFTDESVGWRFTVREFKEVL